jgi:hypothetical protein
MELMCCNNEMCAPSAKAITCPQVQFVLVMIHAFQLLFIDCNYPKAFVWWIGLHAVMFYFLFSDFYKQAYKKKAQRRVRSTRMGIAGPCFYLWCSSRHLYMRQSSVF